MCVPRPIEGNYKMPNKDPSEILLINSSARVVRRARLALEDSGKGEFPLQTVRSLSEGLDKLKHGAFAAVLLGLSLDDSKGIATFDKLFTTFPTLPILIVGGDNDEDLALQAVARGARDYLPTQRLDVYTLTRALNHAMAQQSSEDLLFLERDRAEVTLNSIGDAVLSTDISGHVTYLNLVAEIMTGWRRAEAVGQPLAVVFQIIDGLTRQKARNPMEMAVDENRTVGLTLNCLLIRRDGYESAIEDSAAPIHDRAGTIIGAVIVFHEVSAARAMSHQMTYSAQHDQVTNLPNRILLNDRIDRAIALAQRQRKQLAVIFLDLDHFKYVNDSMGHAVGDKLLQSVSKRLVETLRGSDTVSRQGGDEFVILITDINGTADAAASAKRLLRALSAPYAIEDMPLRISGSIGISIYPQDGADTETLIQNADTAMYRAKETGRNTFQFFQPEMNRRAIERQSLETSLRRALDENEFYLYYQPRVSLTTGKITGVEALVRWRQSDGETISPDSFIPAAEDSGLIIPIDRWVLREACRQSREWQDSGLPPVPMSVNVAAVEFHSESFVDGVRTTLAETGLDAQWLEFEITERVLMQDIETTKNILLELKAVGVRVAIDDFGTGYSSLSYLHRFPVDILKIDRSFISQITQDPADSRILEAILGIGKSLKLLVVAEGIETLSQQSYLWRHECAEAQGYLFSPPLPAERLAQLMDDGIGGEFKAFTLAGAA